MRFLLWLFCVVVVCIWLIGWGIVIAERMPRKLKYRLLRLNRTIARKLCDGFWPLLMLIICSGCAQTTCVPIEVPSCPPMLRRATYNAMQADERRDYRIAVEQCNKGD